MCEQKTTMVSRTIRAHQAKDWEGISFCYQSSINALADDVYVFCKVLISDRALLKMQENRYRNWETKEKTTYE